MSDCIFCKIAAKEVNAKIIREDDSVVAFADLNPQAPTHVLIVPKKHIASLADCAPQDTELLGRIQLFAKELAAALGIKDGFRLVTNNGRKAGQSMEHLHYHLLGGRRMNWPPG